MRFGVLGPLAVWTADGVAARVPEQKVRGLLADLLVHAGRPVSTSRLIDDLWGEALPANPTNTLQTRVSQLRRALEAAAPGGRDLVVSQPPGYLLRVAPESVDAGQFRTLVARARGTADPAERVTLLTDALALWRGSAYADFATEAFARAAVDQLAEERLVAVEERAEARLALGEHHQLVGELAALVSAEPLRQRLRAAYMRALYGAGRHSEALDTYMALRDHLAGTLGLDPSPELVALHQAVLRQDPELTPPAPRTAAVVAAATSSVRSGVTAGEDGRDPARNNLPAPLDSLVGREQAVARVRQRLAAGRLVTLTGPGGVGKTRLAVEVARQLAEAEPRRYADGVWLVELAAVGQGPAAADSLAAQLVRAVSGVLGLDRAAPERPGPPAQPDAELDELAEQLAAVLRDRESLLVLDNCEHVIAPVATLTGLLLRASPGLRVLATSREPLEIPGESLWEVPPLELPARDAVEPAALARASAVALFTARASAADPEFTLDPQNAAAVATICRRLDGIPLALELAATRVRALGVHDVAARLDDRFRLLSAGRRGVPQRQQTLRAVIDWSWEMLTGPERVVLRRLALHPDSCTLAAAEVICADDRDAPVGAAAAVTAAEVPEVLARLVDRSLVVRVPVPAGVRYRLLESIGAYSLERLHESGEFEAVLQRHIAYYIGLSSRSEPRLYGHQPLFRYLSRRHEQLAGGQAPGGGPVARSAPMAPPAYGLVSSADGTPIAYDRTGSGPAVILVGGALNDRLTFGPLAAALAERFTVYSYDRRGRGGSGDTPPYRVAREVEDLAAVVGIAGGEACALGVSSGAVLAGAAAAQAVALRRLVMIEPPFIMDDSRPAMPADSIARLDALVAAGRRGDAVELFLTGAVEMPAEVVAPMRSSPEWAGFEAMAHTLGYDLAVMGDFQLPANWAGLAVPALVLVGGDSARWRRHAAQATVDLLPRAVLRTLTGQSHDAPPAVLAPILADFFAGAVSGSAA